NHIPNIRIPLFPAATIAIHTCKQAVYFILELQQLKFLFGAPDRANAQTPSLDSLTTAKQTTSNVHRRPFQWFAPGVQNSNPMDNISTKMVSDHKSPNGAANYRPSFASCYFFHRFFVTILQWLQ
ncbi:hypothetical protein OS493_028701, partial [Desmophyllum pertusum]